MEARSAAILCSSHLMFPTLMHLPDDGEPDRSCLQKKHPHSPLEPQFLVGREREGLGTRAPVHMATRAVLQEQAGLQHDLSFPCFSGIVKVWDAVSHYIPATPSTFWPVAAPGNVPLRAVGTLTAALAVDFSSWQLAQLQVQSSSRASVLEGPAAAQTGLPSSAGLS